MHRLLILTGRPLLHTDQYQPASQKQVNAQIPTYGPHKKS